MQFQMDQADYRDALHALEAVTGSFLVPISDRLFMVVKDTPQKRKEEEPYAAVIIPLPEPTTQQDLTAMVTAVQQTCGIQKVAWDSHANIVVMRDAVSKVLPAQQLFEDLLYPRAQVMVEMDFVEVTKSNEPELRPAAAEFLPAGVVQHFHAERAAARPEHFGYAAFRRRGGPDRHRHREPAIGGVAVAFRQQTPAAGQRALRRWPARHHSSGAKVSHCDRRLFRPVQFQRTGSLPAAAFLYLRRPRPFAEGHAPRAWHRAM